MSKELTTQRVTLSFPTLITDCISSHVAKEFETNVSELAQSLNKGIERGVETSKTAADLESLVQQGRGVLKAGEAIRMEFTRPLDKAKTTCITQQREYLKRLQESTDKADMMCIEESDRIKEAEWKAQQDAIDEQNRLDEEARKKEERNRNISIGKGGTGDVKSVVAPVVQRPVSLASMRNTTKLKYRADAVKIREAIDKGVRKIPGIKIYPVWHYVIEDRSLVPQEYKSAGR